MRTKNPNNTIVFKQNNKLFMINYGAILIINFFINLTYVRSLNTTTEICVLHNYDKSQNERFKPSQPVVLQFTFTTTKHNEFCFDICILSS